MGTRFPASLDCCIVVEPRGAVWQAGDAMKLQAIPTLLLLVCWASWAGPASEPVTTSARARAAFQHPSREYSTGPLWVWNDMLTEEQIRSTLRDLAGQDVKQVWVHPRPGLMTPYLGQEWFRLWKIALQEAQRLDMNVWIYDENSYPSGFAGGLVPQAMPESRGRGLAIHESKTAPQWSDDLIAAYRGESSGDGSKEVNFSNVTSQVKAGEALPEGIYLVASETRAKDSPWHGNRCYVNLLSPGVTEKFLELTLEPYRREVGQEFGRRVPGVFTDEPNIRPADGLPWSEVLADQFQKRWGYDLLAYLPSLVRPVGDWQKVRHNYYQVLNEQFIQHWAQPYWAYCASNHLEFTGHYWDHDWPHCSGVPDNMATYAWHQRPAIDCLMNQYAEHTHAQFGNVRMVKELSSVANQLGARRTLCEIYGAGGWDLRFEDMKRIGDWLEVLGVNTLNQHLSYVTLRGARKRDHPQSFSYHEPWWEAYHVSADYFARLSAALSQGEQINRVLVLEPTTTAWMYQGDEPRLKALGDGFFNLVMALEAAQVEYDIASEDVLARHGRVQQAYACPAVIKMKGTTLTMARHSELAIGNRSYAAVVLPALTENLNARTVELLEELARAPLGGQVLCLGEPPARVDGASTERVQQLAKTGSWTRSSMNDAVADLTPEPGVDDFAIARQAHDQGILFHHRRKLQDGELLFLVNTSIQHGSAGEIFSGSARSVQKWDLYDGRTVAYGSEPSGPGLKAGFNLPPSGSLLLFLSNEPRKATANEVEAVTVVRPSGGTEVRRCQPNVLTLDYVDVSAGGKTLTNAYCYRANQFAWQQNGMARNPWDSAVQYGDELISKRFPADSGFEASYRFVLEASVPTNLAVVIERPDLYTVTLNDQPLSHKPGDWWLDKAFGRIPVATAARTGSNTLVLRASPFTMFHEIEPVYVLGDFSLAPSASGFVIQADQPLRLRTRTETGAGRQGWNSQGHPFYSGGVSYREEFNLPRRAGRTAVGLGQWCGSVAGVTVNGRFAGYIDAPPWELDITRHVKTGKNLLEVTVIGTLKNTLGPHHGNPALGAAWPASFHQGPASGPPPGAQYDTVAYGLFEPFILKQFRNLPAR